MKCSICKGTNVKKLFNARDSFKKSNEIFEIRKCLDCYIGFTFPALNREEIKKYYLETALWKKEYKAKNIFIKLIRWLEEKYIDFWADKETKRLSKFVNKGKILDIGCGTGFRFKYFKKYGFKDCYGIEPTYVKKTQKANIEKRTFDEFDSPENSFDIVTFYHVFEHIDKPVKCLKKIKEILKPDGVLVIQIPNFNAIQGKVFRNKWLALSVPSHYFHFTPKGIRKLLEKNGFNVKKIDYTPSLFHPIFWGISALKEVNPQLIWAREESGNNPTLWRIIQLILILLLLPFSFIETFLGKGAHMAIYAIKKDK